MVRCAEPTDEIGRVANKYRSFLFVPGHRLDWALRAPGLGADAIILDLEDAVPLHRKHEARRQAAEALAALASERIGRFVRVNGWGTGHLVDDLLAVVGPSLDG